MTDLIERQAAIDAVDEGLTMVFVEHRDIAEKIINKIPSAQADLPIKEKCAFCPHCNNCDVNDDLSIQPCVDTISRQAANTKMKKYRKKPVVIEAYQTNVALDIETLEGIMHANVGDYIITGVNGERYPCKPDIFEKTYEEISDE